MSKSKYKDKFFEFTSALNEKMEMFFKIIKSEIKEIKLLKK